MASRRSRAPARSAAARSSASAADPRTIEIALRTPAHGGGPFHFQAECHAEPGGMDPGRGRSLWYDGHDARSGWTRGTRSRPPSDLVVLLKSIARARPTESGVRPAEEVPHHGHTRRYQRLRPDRSTVAQGTHRASP